jgi:butyrate kinase
MILIYPLKFQKSLTINPGSTTTKIAVYKGAKPLFDYTTDHLMKSLRKFDTVYEQAEYRG